MRLCQSLADSRRSNRCNAQLSPRPKVTDGQQSTQNVSPGSDARGSAFAQLRIPAGYFCLGGKSFNNFCIALFRFFSFFSWFELGSIVLVAVPVQTSCFEVGSYMSTTRLPTLMVDCVADPIPPPKPRPVPQAFHFFPGRQRPDSQQRGPPCRCRSW